MKKKSLLSRFTRSYPVLAIVLFLAVQGSAAWQTVGNVTRVTRSKTNGVVLDTSKKGYVGWGAPPRHPRTDGSVVPCAPAGSLMFTPDITLPALKEMKAVYGDKIYGRYGFADAFNPHNGWVDRDVIGIDLGITLLSIENLRSGKVWYWFMQNDEIRRAMRRVSLY